MRDDQTVAIIVIGLDQSPENVLNKAGFNVENLSCRRSLINMKRWQGLVKEFSEYLPVNETPQLTLNEGSTPLIYCEKLSKIRYRIICEI